MNLDDFRQSLSEANPPAELTLRSPDYGGTAKVIGRVRMNRISDNALF
jgi:hypothetical protein